METSMTRLAMLICCTILATAPALARVLIFAEN